MSSIIFSNEEARFLRLVLRLVDRPVPDLDADQASTLLESLIAAGLDRHARPGASDRGSSGAEEAIRVLVIGERKAGKEGLLSKLSSPPSSSSSSSPPGSSFSHLQPNPHGSLHGCRQTMTIPTRHHTIEVYELSPDCLQVQPVQASSTEQDTNVTSLFATEHEQHQHQQVTTVSETEAEHLAQALAITEAAILVYDTGDEASLGYLRSLAGLLDRAVELHQHQHRQQIPTSQQHQHQLRKKTKEKKTSPSDSKPAPSNEPRNSGTARRSAWPSLKRVSSAETKAEETNSSKEERPALPVSPLPPLTPSSPDQGLDQDQIRRSAQEEEEQKYHFLLLGVKPDGPPVDPERSHNQQNRTTTTPHSRGYQRTSTWSAPSVEFLEIASSSRSEWNMALDILGDKVLGSRRSRGARSCRYRRDCQDGNGQSGVMVEEDTNTVSAQDGGTKGLSQDQGHQHQNQGQGAKKHPQTQSKMQRHEAGKDHTQTQPAFESLESMALTLFSAPSSKLSNTSRHLRFNPHHHHHHHHQQQQNKSTLARSSRWGLLRSVLSVGSVLRADVKRKTAQRQLAAGERK